MAYAFLGVSGRSRLKAVAGGRHPNFLLALSIAPDGPATQWLHGTFPEDVLKKNRDEGVTRRMRTRPIAAVNVPEIGLVSFDPKQCLHHRSRGPKDPYDVPPVEQRHRVVKWVERLPRVVQ
uniref:Uncharacterized protein n=1 Tax=Hyaloperonospora arabidopsidis (strain Emoy2) TaxID=559515 RepID=M4BVD1_HYAAE